MKSTITVPDFFSFRDRNVYHFESALEVFDWDIHDVQVRIDLAVVVGHAKISI